MPCLQPQECILYQCSHADADDSAVLLVENPQAVALANRFFCLQINCNLLLVRRLCPHHTVSTCFFMCCPTSAVGGLKLVHFMMFVTGITLLGKLGCILALLHVSVAVPRIAHVMLLCTCSPAHSTHAQCTGTYHMYVDASAPMRTSQS